MMHLAKLRQKPIQSGGPPVGQKSAGVPHPAEAAAAWRGILPRMTREQIRSAAMELDPAEREVLAEELLLSLPDADRDAVDAAWLAEARRRDAAFALGGTTARRMNEIT